MPQTATYTATITLNDIVNYPTATGIFTEDAGFIPFATPMSLDPSLTYTFSEYLNTLGLGVFTVSNDGVTVTIVSQNNTHNLVSVQISTGVDANFIASDVVVDQEVYGCTNAAAINYNPEATVDDGTCYFNNSIKGCTDINALNYNPDATVDDGTCVYPLSDEQKIACCLAKEAHRLSVNERDGKKKSCCLVKKVRFLEGVVDILQGWKKPGSVVGYLEDVIANITVEPNYTPNIDGKVMIDMDNVIDGDISPVLLNSYKTSTLNGVKITLYIEKEDGTVVAAKETGYVQYANAEFVTIAINDLVNSAAGTQDNNGVNPLLSEYYSSWVSQGAGRGGILTIHAFKDNPNNLRGGNNNAGAFRDGRVVYVNFTVYYPPGYCNYESIFTADSNDGIILCSGTPNAGTVNIAPLNVSSCDGDTAVLTVTGASLVTGVTYIWQESDDDGATDPYADIPMASGLTLNALYTDTGKWYRVRSICEYTSLTNTSAGVLLQASPPPIAVVASGGDVCSGNDISLSADNVAPGQLTGNTYSWTSDNGFTSNDQNPSISSGSPYFPSIGQTVTYTCTVTNMYGCSVSGDTSLTVNGNPTIVVDTVNANDFTVHAVGGLAPYSYTIDFINFNTDGIFTGLTSGTTYTVYVLDGNACQAQIDVTTL